ncbi:MAG: hypothetical protein IJX16_00190 [Clostridia bacterium]|nr:hypothetical protein [Clostridia bacterium]
MYDVISMKSVAKQLNDWTYTDYYYRLMLIARSRFEWANLPNCINEKWIERYLFNEGNCLFYDDKIKGFMVSKATASGMLNPYDECVSYTPYNTGYIGKPLENYEECILIQNNDIMLPTSPTIQLYAYRLAELTRTIDVNVTAQKTPVVVLCSDKQKLSFKRMFANISDNEVAVYGDKNLDIDAIKALRIDAPVVFDKLEQQKHCVWNECMTFLGFNNANQDKRERLVANEVTANDEQVGASANVMLKARQDACNRINELFNLNISVKLRDMPTPQLNDFERGVSNGSE